MVTCHDLDGGTLRFSAIITSGHTVADLAVLAQSPTSEFFLYNLQRCICHVLFDVHIIYFSTCKFISTVVHSIDCYEVVFLGVCYIVYICTFCIYCPSLRLSDLKLSQ